MTNVVVAFSRPEDVKSIKNILTKSGFQVIAACNSGAQTLACVEDLSSGIIVCGYRLTDMMFLDLYEDLSPEFPMLMVSSPNKWTSRIPEDIVCLPMPLKVHDLVSTLEMMGEAQSRRRKKQRRQPKQRGDEERTIMMRAKNLLMERNNMTEEEAHRYIQKCSMDSGTNLTETAQMVISLINR